MCKIFMANLKYKVFTIFLAAIVCSCSAQTSNVVVEKAAFEKASALSQSMDAAEKLRSLTISSDSITSLDTSVESSVYDGQRRGVRLSESIRSKTDGKRVLSSYSIKAYSHTGKDVSMEGSSLYDANKIALQIKQDGSSYRLSSPSMSPSFLFDVEQGKRYANAIERGESQFSDDTGFIRAGYMASGLVAISFERTYHAETTVSRLESCIAATLIYEEFESALRIKQSLMYYTASCQSQSLSYFAGAYVTDSFGYEQTSISDSIDDNLPAYEQPYICTVSSEGFGFLPYLDVSSLFIDGKSALMVAPSFGAYHSSFMPAGTGYLQEGLIHGKSDNDIGDLSIFANRLSNIV